METNTVRWSDELYRIYGLEPREFAATYEAFLARLHPDDREHISRTILHSAHSGEPFYMTERVVRPDGSIRYLNTRGRVTQEKDGRRLYGVCHDVTDLREAERERSRSEQRERVARIQAERSREELSNILERITDAFIALDSEWRYTYVNRKAAEIFGRERDSLIGKHIWTEFPEGVGQPFHHMYEKAMDTQLPQTIEAYYPPYDRWFENRIYPSPQGLAIYFQDVTERKKKEEELRTAQERLDRTEQYSLVMVTHTSPGGRYLKVPESFCRLLGYSEEELLSKTYRELTHPEDHDADAHALDILLRGEARSIDLEKRYVRKDGGEVWVTVNSSAVYDAGGQLVQFVNYVRDITEKHGMEEQLRYQELQETITGLPNLT
jgi:PAS domain S-box-containing protein